MVKSYELHEGWGEDSLSHFQQIAFENELWAHSENTLISQLLVECDDFISTSISHVTSSPDVPANTGTMLFMNAHNHFRASARLSLSGQFLPVFPTARASLETALYGWYLQKEPKMVKDWHNKPSAKKELYKWHDTFSFAKIAEKVGQIDPSLTKGLKNLHQIAIDFGAHPNTAALYSNLTPLPEAGERVYVISYIHTEGKLVFYTFNFLLEVALAVLGLLVDSHPDLRYKIDFQTRFDSLSTDIKYFQNETRKLSLALNQGASDEQNK